MAALHAGSAAGQAPGEPDSLNATLKAPAKVTKAQLRKGLPIKVTCQPECDARLQLTGPIGIITSKSGQVAAGRTVTLKLKAKSFQLNALKRGAWLTVQLEALHGNAAVRKTKKLRLS